MGRRRKRATTDKRMDYHAKRRDLKVLLGILMLRRDEHLNADEREKAYDRAERRRQKFLAMGFSPQALRPVSDGEKAPLSYGIADAFLEQSSRRFHGVPPDAADKKQGRKRKGGAAPDPARYVPPPDN